MATEPRSDFAILGEGNSFNARAYRRLVDQGMSAEEASLAVYGAPADSAAAALQTKVAAPLESLPDSAAEAVGFLQSRENDPESLRGLPAERIIQDWPKSADQLDSDAPGDEPKLSFGARVEQSRRRYGDLRTITEAPRVAASRLSGTAFMGGPAFSAAEAESTGLPRERGEPVIGPPTGLEKLWMTYAPQVEEWFQGDGQRAIAMLSGTAAPFILGQQWLFSISAEEPPEVAAAKFNPSFIVGDDETTLTEKNMWEHWGHTAARWIGGFFRGDFASMLTAALHNEQMGADIIARYESGEFLQGQDLIEAGMAGRGIFAPLAGFDEDGQFHRIQFSSDPEERAREWAMVRENAAEAYAEIVEHHGRFAGNLVMGLVAAGGAVLDVGYDPAIITASIPRLAIVGARQGVTKLNPLLGTRILGRIAQRTGDYVDVRNYLHAAKAARSKWVARADAAGGFDKLSPQDQLKAAQAKVLWEEAEMMVKHAADYPVESIVLAGAKAADMDVPAPALDLAKAKFRLDTAGTDFVRVPDVPRPRALRLDKYADVIEILPEIASPALRKAILLRGIRRNILAAADEGAPESLLRKWESLYTDLKNTPDDQVGRHVSARLGTPGTEALDPELAAKVSYLGRKGEIILQTLDVSDVEKARHISTTPADIEFQAVAAQSLLHGVAPEQIAMRHSSIGAYMHATTHMPKRVTKMGMIDIEAINEHNRTLASTARRTRKRRIKALEKKTEGYDLQEVVGKDGKTQQRLTGPLSEDPAAPPLAPKARAQIIEDLQELKRLRTEDPREAYQFDYHFFGQRPDDIKPIAANWKQTWIEQFGDKMARTLWPETWVPPVWDELRSILYVGREPGRALGAVFPRMWTRIRNGTAAVEWERTRMVRAIADALEESGAYVEHTTLSAQGGIRPRRVPTGSVKLKDQALNDKMYRVLDTPPKIHDELGRVVDNPEFFRLMDELPEGARNAVRRIRQTLDFYARKQGIAETDMYISGYITHMFGGEHGRVLLRELTHDPESFINVRHLMSRTDELDMAKAETNLAKILDLYASGMARKMHLEPMLHDLDSMLATYNRRALQGRSPELQAAGTWLDSEVKRIKAVLRNEPTVAGQWADKMAMRITESARASRIGTWFRETTGRDFLYQPGDVGRSMMVLTNSFYASLLSGNPRYAPMQIATGIATTAAETGLIPTMGHALLMASPETQMLVRASGVGRSFSRIWGAAPFRKMVDIASDWHFLTPSINSSEFYIRGVTSHGAMDHAMRKAGFAHMGQAHEAGYSGAILMHGLRVSEEVNHFFGILGKPTHLSRFSRSFGVAATQFLSFFPKQTEQILKMTLRNPGAFYEYMAVSGLIQRVAVQQLGIDMSQYLGLGYRPDRVEDPFQSVAATTLLHGLDAGRYLFAGALGFDVDPMAADRATEQYLESLNTMVPLATAYRTRFAAFSALANAFADGDGATVAKLRRSGDRVRDRNLSLGGPLGEIPALLTGLKSTLDDFDDQRAKLKREQDRDRAYRAYMISREFRRASGEGNFSGAMDLWQQLLDSGFLPGIDMMDPSRFTTMVQRQMAAQALEEHLRNMLTGPGQIEYTTSTEELDRLERALSR